MAPRDEHGPTRSPLPATATAVLVVVIAVVGALASLAAVGGLQHAQRDRAVARVTYDDVELRIQARRDDTLGQASLASTSTEDEDLDEDLDALVAAQPGARADVDALRARERELREGGATDERLLSSTISSLDQVRRTAVRPFDDDVDGAERRLRRTITATAVLTAAAALAAGVLARRARARAR